MKYIVVFYYFVFLFGLASVKGTNTNEVDLMDYLKTYLPEEAGTLLAKDEITRKVLATVCGNILGGTSDAYPADVEQSEWFAQGAAVSCKYRLFGSYTAKFELNPDNYITRLEVARLAIRLYAAITGIEDYRVDPGLPCGITDLTDISVEKQWYVYSAIYNGFIDEASNGKFEPARNLTCIEAAKLIYSVVERCRREGNEKAATKEKIDKNFRMFPVMNKPVARMIETLVFSSLSSDDMRLASSIQGIVNREEIKVLYMDAYNQYMYDYLISKGYIEGTAETHADPMKIVEKYIHLVKGAVVVDPGNRYTINTAETVAAVENRIIITPGMISEVQGLGITDIKDLRDYQLKTLAQAQKWAYENYWMFMRRDVMHHASPSIQYDAQRDYMIQMRVPSYFMPNANECDDYMAQYELVDEILKKMPPNIPVIGFPPSYDDQLNQLGLDEYDGVLHLSQYGKYYYPQDWVGNLSFFSAIKVSETTRKFKPQTKRLTYDPNVKYICLNMCDSGDAASYIQYGFNQFQWSDPIRGTVPFSMCYGYGHYDMLPTFTEYFFSSTKEYDYIYAAGSALGYMIPFVNNFGASFNRIKLWSYGYASIALVDDDNVRYSSTDDICKDHYHKVNTMMGKTGMTSQMVYSHANTFWQTEDYDFVNKYHTGLDNLTSIMADLFRSAPLAQVNPSVYTLSDGKPMFHCITGYSPFDDDLFISNKTVEQTKQYDEYASNWFINEIVNSTTNGGTMNLYHCAIYSWQINARRISMIIDKMNRQYPGKYVFVTVGQLEDLYRQSMGDFTGVEKTGSNPSLHVNIYPNPFTHEVRISDSNTEIRRTSSLQVINTAGVVVHTQQLTSPGETIRLEHLPAGLYLFHVENGRQENIVKVIKNQ